MFVYIVTFTFRPSLSNGSINAPATYVHAALEGCPSLGDREVNTPGILGNGDFDVVHVITT